MAKAAKILLEGILAISLAFGIPPAYSQEKNEAKYVMSVGNRSPDKADVIKLNQKIKSLGYNPKIDKEYLLDGTTSYFTIFETKTTLVKSNLYKIATDNGRWPLFPAEKDAYYDKKEIKTTVFNFLKTMFAEDAEGFCSFFSEETFKKEKNLTDTIAASLNEHNYEKYDLIKIFDNMQIAGNDEIQLNGKETYESTKMKNGGYLVRINFKKGTVDSMDLIFKKINNKWKIIGS